MSVYIYTNMCIYTYICMYIHMHMWIYMHTYSYLCYIYICTYLYMNIPTVCNPVSHDHLWLWSSYSFSIVRTLLNWLLKMDIEQTFEKFLILLWLCKSPHTTKLTTQNAYRAAIEQTYTLARCESGAVSQNSTHHSRHW